MNVAIVVLRYWGRRIIIICCHLPSLLQSLRSQSRIKLIRNSCEWSWLSRNHLIWNHYWSFTTDWHAISANKIRLLVWMVWVHYHVVVRCETFFNLSIKVDNIFELIKNIFVCLLQSALAPWKIWSILRSLVICDIWRNTLVNRMSSISCSLDKLWKGWIWNFRFAWLCLRLDEWGVRTGLLDNAYGLAWSIGSKRIEAIDVVVVQWLDCVLIYPL